MAGHRYSYYAYMARRPDDVHDFTCTIHEDDGCTRIHIRGSNTLRCPGVALRFSAVIDCTPAEDRMPPVTIDFVKNEPDGASSSNAPPTLVAGFTREPGDFIVISRWDFEAMVAAAGFPPECAPVVENFCIRSASTAANSFWSGVAITVEMAPAGNPIDDDHSDDEEEDEVGEECPICLSEFVVGTWQCGNSAAVVLARFPSNVPR